jgi:flagellum-specific peptidoglycan hydrolase FlgJ
MLTPSQQTAVDQIAEASIACQVYTGCPAPLSAAQAIFESKYLERAPKNNCFGIKVDQHGSGEQYTLTHEFLNGKWEHMPLAFETYASLADCFSDHARLIQSGVYEAAWDDYRGSPRESADLDRYIAAVSKHYATDPGYCASITAEAHSATVQNAILKVIDAGPEALELHRASDDGMPI